MADTVKLPIAGEVKKSYAYAGLAAAGGISIWVIIKKRKATAAQASLTQGAATATDSAGNTGVIDPATSFVYGSPEDTQALAAAQTGAGFAPFSAGTGTGSVSTGVSTPAAGTNPSGITTNTEWLAQAIGSLPGDSSTIQTALDAVLGGLAVTQDQKNLFMEAIGVLGTPPPQGYPTPIKTVDTAAQPVAASNASPVPPDVRGQTVSAGIQELTSRGWFVINVMEQGIAGTRPAQQLPISEYGTHLITGQSVSGRQVSLEAA